MTAPAILLMEFALNKVITHLCNSHRQDRWKAFALTSRSNPTTALRAECASGYCPPNGIAIHLDRASDYS
jgi:hypothetical protein